MSCNKFFPPTYGYCMRWGGGDEGSDMIFLNRLKWVGSLVLLDNVEHPLSLYSLSNILYSTTTDDFTVFAYSI